MTTQTSVVCASAIAIALIVSAAGAATYSGSLSSASTPKGIDGVGKWMTDGTVTFAWEVTDNTTAWHYKYTLSVPTQSISHFIIEVSSIFSLGDMSNAQALEGSFGSILLEDFDQSNGNPDIPGTIHGIKFDDTTGTTLTIEFDSIRKPVWGDFYAKDGGNPTNQAWNVGLTASDTDPSAPASNGSVDNHVLVPDSYVPEPASLALLIGSVGCLLRRRRTH